MKSYQKFPTMRQYVDMHDGAAKVAKVAKVLAFPALATLAALADGEIGKHRIQLPRHETGKVVFLDAIRRIQR
jgi:hypothetical protein